MNFRISKQLAHAYVAQQETTVLLQNEVLTEHPYEVKLQKTVFYTKSLASLAVCNEALVGNAQLKELNYTRIKMLRTRISEVSLQLEHFKTLLKAIRHSTNND